MHKGHHRPHFGGPTLVFLPLFLYTLLYQYLLLALHCVALALLDLALEVGDGVAAVRIDLYNCTWSTLLVAAEHSEHTWNCFCWRVLIKIFIVVACRLRGVVCVEG